MTVVALTSVSGLERRGKKGVLTWRVGGHTSSAQASPERSASPSAPVGDGATQRISNGISREAESRRGTSRASGKHSHVSCSWHSPPSGADGTGIHLEIPAPCELAAGRPITAASPASRDVAQIAGRGRSSGRHRGSPSAVPVYPVS